MEISKQDFIRLFKTLLDELLPPMVKEMVKEEVRGQFRQLRVLPQLKTEDDE